MQIGKFSELRQCAPKAELNKDRYIIHGAVTVQGHTTTTKQPNKKQEQNKQTQTNQTQAHGRWSAGQSMVIWNASEEMITLYQRRRSPLQALGGFTKVMPPLSFLEAPKKGFLAWRGRRVSLNTPRPAERHRASVKKNESPAEDKCKKWCVKELKNKNHANQCTRKMRKMPETKA